MLLYVYIYFMAFFCFSSKNLCFYYFRFFFFDEVSNFHKRILTNKKPELVIRNCQRNSMCEGFLSTRWCHTGVHVLHKIQKQLFTGNKQKNCSENFGKLPKIYLWWSTKLVELQALFPQFYQNRTPPQFFS